MSVSRSNRFLGLLLPVALLICGASQALHADPPPPASKGKHTVGSVVRLLAIDRTRLYYLLIMQEEFSEGETVPTTSRLLRVSAKGATRSKVATAATIVVVNKAAALKSARAAQSRLTSAVTADLAAGRIRSDQVAQLRASLTADLARDVRVVSLNSSQLQRLLGSPAMVTGKIAMLSDLPGDITGAISGVTGIALMEAGAPGFATVGFNTLLGAGTAAEVGAIAPMVLAAGAAGYATGTALNGVYTAIGSAITGKSNYTLGDAAYDLFVGDDDTPAPAASTSTEGQSTTNTTTTTPAPADKGSSSGTTTPADNSAGNTDQSSTDNSDDDNNDDDNSDDNNGDGSTTTDDGSTPSGTALPPDLQNGSPIGTLVMYAATGLGRSEMQRQLAAIDIVGGGALGAERRRVTDLHWDQMLGGFYLNTIVRGIEARRNSRGGRDRVGSYIQLPDKRTFINGLVCPPPQLDYMKVAVAR